MRTPTRSLVEGTSEGEKCEWDKVKALKKKYKKAKKKYKEDKKKYKEAKLVCEDAETDIFVDVELHADEKKNGDDRCEYCRFNDAFLQRWPRRHAVLL